MTRDRHLTAASLLALLLMTIHVSDDIRRGISPPGADNIGGVVIFLVWLVGTVLLAGRPTGYVVMLLGGIFAAAMPVLHMTGSRYAALAQSDGGFFFVWTLFAVGTAGAFAAILAAMALWRRSWRIAK